MSILGARVQTETDQAAKAGVSEKPNGKSPVNQGVREARSMKTYSLPPQSNGLEMHWNILFLHMVPCMGSGWIALWKTA